MRICKGSHKGAALVESALTYPLLLLLTAAVLAYAAAGWNQLRRQAEQHREQWNEIDFSVGTAEDR